MAINQTVIVVASAEALLSKQFNLQKEIALILEQSEDNYAALIEALEDKGVTDVIDYLNEHEVPWAYIDVDYEHVEFRAQNPTSKALAFLVPFSFNDAELDLDIEENMVMAEDEDNG